MRMRAACSGKNGRGTDRPLRHARPRRHPGRHARRRRSARSAATSPAARNLIEFLYHRARPFLFSTSHPPAVAAACIAALDVLEQEPQIIERLVGQHALLQGRPEGARLQHRPEREPDHAGDRRRRRAGDEAVGPRCSRRACSRRASRFPTVARDKARVRTIVTATHTRDELQFALDVFAQGRPGARRSSDRNVRHQSSRLARLLRLATRRI